MQADEEEDPIEFSWHDFKHTDVFLIAKKVDIDNPTFKFKIKYRFEENLGLSLAGKVALSIICPMIAIGLSIFALYHLH